MADATAARIAVLGEYRLGDQPEVPGRVRRVRLVAGLPAFCASAAPKVRFAFCMNAKRGIPSWCANSASGTVRTPAAIVVMTELPLIRSRAIW